MFEFENGDKVVSKITGYKGMVTSRSDHMNGCNRFWVQPPVDKEGKNVEGSWVDGPELELQNGKKKKEVKKAPGGFPSTIK